MIKIGDNDAQVPGRLYVIPGLGVQYAKDETYLIEVSGKFKTATTTRGLSGVIGMEMEDAFQMLYELLFNHSDALAVRQQIIERVNSPHVEGRS